MDQLLLITVGYGTSLLVGLGFGVFVLLQNPKGAAHRMFFLMCLSLALYQLFFILAANTPPSALGYLLWFLNIVDVFIAIFYFNFIVLALGVYEKWKRVLASIWMVGLGILGGAILFPQYFLPSVTPKLYFASYLNDGPLYTAMFVFFITSFILSFAVMFVERARRGEEGKRRVDYYIFSLFYGVATGPTAFALVFDVPIDPLPSALLGTFVIPMVYGMIKKDLLDIRLVIRKTLVLTFVIAGIAGLLTAVSLLSRWFADNVPGYAIWMVPLASAFAATFAGYLYARKAAESERLKYEFINVVTHKFRTPLTRVRWAVEALKEREDIPADAKEIVQSIRESDLELIQLSNLLIDAARTEKEHYAYTYTEQPLPAIARGVFETFAGTMREKSIRFSFDVPENLPPVYADKDRLASAIHVLAENAVAYTPKGGEIAVALSAELGAVRLSVKDSGIGLTEEEHAHMFKKFYRGNRARSADTEGVGVGLSMAKSIIERHRGTIGASSLGAGKGSEFWLTLPVK